MKIWMGRIPILLGIPIYGEVISFIAYEVLIGLCMNNALKC